MASCPTIVAQFLAMCSASTRAQERCISVPFSSPSRANRGASERRTRPSVYQRQPSTHADTLSDAPDGFTGRWACCWSNSRSRWRRRCATTRVFRRRCRTLGAVGTRGRASAGWGRGSALVWTASRPGPLGASLGMGWRSPLSMLSWMSCSRSLADNHSCPRLQWSITAPQRVRAAQRAMAFVDALG
jgi:hypothetical protein